MTGSLTNPAEKVGLSPGSAVHVGDVRLEKTVIYGIDYNKDRIEELASLSPEEIPGYMNSDTVTWVTVEGLVDADIIELIGKIADIHPLVVEDILTAHQRPKFEEYEHYLYIAVSSLLSEDDDLDVESEQISILLLKNTVFLFREKSDDLFHSVMQRIKDGRGRIRGLGADYLAYCLLDIIVDRLFVLTDMVDDRINLVEDSLLTSDPLPDTPLIIQSLKRELIYIRKHVLPIKELTTGLLRAESELIQEKTQIYLRDVSDHAVRVAESVELYREILSELSAVYMSGLSNRMNEVMKVLTVFASVFIPLTFIAGIYGMNFKYMPELGWKWAYPALWAVFIILPACLLLYFKKKKWF